MDVNEKDIKNSQIKDDKAGKIPISLEESNTYMSRHYK